MGDEDENVKIEDESSEDDDDVPIARRKAKKPVIKDEDEDDSAKAKPAAASSSKAASKRARDDEDDDEEDDVPISKMKKTGKAAAPVKAKAEPAVKKEKEEPAKKEKAAAVKVKAEPVKKEAPPAKEAPKKEAPKREAAKPAAKKKKEESEDDEDEDVNVESEDESPYEEDDDDSDAPKGKRKAPAKKKAPPPKRASAASAKKKKEESSDESDDSDSDEDSDAKPKKKKPAAKKQPAKKAAPKPKAKAPAKKKKKGSDDDDSSSSDEEEDDDDVPLSKRKASDKGKGKGKKGKGGEIVEKKERVSKLKQEEELIWKWWRPEEQEIIKLKEEKGIKWITLEHAGVMFPDEYKPHGVKMLYDGKPVQLQPEEEEIATFFAAMLDSDYTKKPKFRDNFFKCWSEVLNRGRSKKSERHIIQDLDRCDFTPIYNYLKDEKEKKKAMSKEEKTALKERREAVEARFKVAMVDGHKEKVGNFKIEPPGLFRGRGEHPKMGMLKRRVTPEEVTINIGKEAHVPEPPPGHKWEKVIHDNTVTWLAHWKDNVNDQDKYVWLAATSSFKGMADFQKYENARKLKGYIGEIRKTYTANLKNKDWATRQRACAVYLIDRLALRAGNEKDTEEEADTVGCCSLRVEHISFSDDADCEITLDFLGKDSMQYHNTVKVDATVFKCLKEFAERDAAGGRKKPSHDLFDKLDTSSLNKHLKDLMPGLTAKVFRTFNASITLDRLLHEAGDMTERPLNERLVEYNTANREVAILCNHQRSVPKNHQEMMGKLDDRMKEMQDEKERYEKYAKRCKKEGEISITEEIKSKKKKKEGTPGKKGEKDDEDDDDDGPKERTRTLDEEKCKRHLANLAKRIDTLEAQMRIKDDNKTVALGTSKINYMDPRITVAWCKKAEVPINKIFNASLQTKFMWALDVEPDFRF